MFNSQKINNDPEPYIIDLGLALGTVRGSQDAGSHWDSHDTYYDPRPEYDNNPNPILIQFRKDRDFTRIENLEDQIPHERHAHKVLEKLVNVYGQDEQ